MQYQVDSDRVAGASAKVAGSVGSIRTEVQAMMRHLQDLQAVWRGGASSAFTGVMSQWQTTQHQVEQALESIQGALSQAATTYSEAEQHATRLFATR